MATLDQITVGTLAQFAAGMGLEAAPCEDGSYVFDFEQAGRLSVFPAAEGDDVILSLTRRILLDDLVAMGRVAALAGYDAGSGRVVLAGMDRAGQPMLALRVPPRGLDLPLLEAGFAQLDGLYRGLGI